MPGCGADLHMVRDGAEGTVVEQPYPDAAGQAERRLKVIWIHWPAGVLGSPSVQAVPGISVEGIDRVVLR